MSESPRPNQGSLEPCGFAELLAALLGLVGETVVLSVFAHEQTGRLLATTEGRLEAGVELGTDDDSLLPIRVGETELMVKAGWLERSWRDPSDASLAVLFHGGVVVEIEPAPERG